MSQAAPPSRNPDRNAPTISNPDSAVFGKTAGSAPYRSRNCTASSTSPGLSWTFRVSSKAPAYHRSVYQPVRQTAERVAAASSTDRPPSARAAIEYGRANAVATAKSPSSWYAGWVRSVSS